MVAAATAMLASTTYAQHGSFAVVNHCPFNLYLWPVAGGEASGKMITLPGGRPDIGYKETYRTTKNNGGVSLKVSPNYAEGEQCPGHTITQLEYTVPNRDDPSQSAVKDLIFYDLSYVDGNPFEGVAMTMETSTGRSGTPCPAGTCGVNQACDVGYLWSTDDVKTHACGLSADVIWTFCSSPGGSLKVPKGLLQTRDALPEPVPEPEAKAKAEADPLAVCVSIGGDHLTLCDEGPPEPPAAPPAPTTTAPPPAPTVAAPAPPPAVTTTSAAAPIVALQKPSAAAPKPKAPVPVPAPAPAPVPSAPQPIAALNMGAPVSHLALTSIEATGVSQWFSWEDSVGKRDLTSHLHNHQAFHRRNRIMKRASA